MSYAPVFPGSQDDRREDENSGGGARKLTQLNNMGAGGTGIEVFSPPRRCKNHAFRGCVRIGFVLRRRRYAQKCAPPSRAGALDSETSSKPSRLGGCTLTLDEIDARPSAYNHVHGGPTAAWSVKDTLQGPSETAYALRRLRGGGCPTAHAISSDPFQQVLLHRAASRPSRTCQSDFCLPPRVSYAHQPGWIDGWGNGIQ